MVGLAGIPPQPSERGAHAPYIFDTYLPVFVGRFPGLQPFGVESQSSFTGADLMQLAQDLDIAWVRMGLRVSWRDLQPQDGGPILWSNLADFEVELRALKEAGIEPVVIVNHSPDWALQAEHNRWCAPIAQDKFDDFASFLGQLAARYSTQEFGVVNWEIGNEVDVDPSLVPVDSGFGCWGDKEDPYYGGRYYGQMLKVITPAIRIKSPGARIWLGGLLLDRPSSPGDLGYPERFLEGVLLAGAAAYFDVLPYHWYPSYFPYKPCPGCNQLRRDYDLYGNSNWTPWGGGTSGKAAYLNSVLAKYNVKKPLSLNETALGCVVAYFDGCDDYPAPAPEFLQAQADFLPKSVLRALNAGVSSYSWFTLSDEWRFTGLTDNNLDLKPVYTAYQAFIDQYDRGTFKGAVSYGTGIEAYVIEGDHKVVHVVWTVADETGRTIQIPQSRLVAIYRGDGVQQGLPPPSGGFYTLNVSFSPTYFQLTP